MHIHWQCMGVWQRLCGHTRTQVGGNIRYCYINQPDPKPSMWSLHLWFSNKYFEKKKNSSPRSTQTECIFCARNMFCERRPTMSLQSAVIRTNNCFDADSHHTCSCYPHFHVPVTLCTCHDKHHACVQSAVHAYCLTCPTILTQSCHLPLLQHHTCVFSVLCILCVFNICGDFQEHNPNV